MCVSETKTDRKQKKLEIRERFDKAACRKLAWSYTIRVVNKVIVSEKEINLWIREGNIWTRLYYDSFPLDWRNCDSESGQKLLKQTNEQLFVQDDSIQFAGGYLEIQDTDLFEHINCRTDLDLKNEKEIYSKLFTENCEPEYPQTVLPGEFLTKILSQIVGLSRPELESLPEPLLSTYRALQLPLPDATLSSTSNPWPPKLAERLEPLGKNIHVEAEFDIPQSTKSFLPLFFFSQDDSDNSTDRGNIQLGIQRQANGKDILFWEISHQEFRTNPYRLYGNQRVVVSQDANWLQVPDTPIPANLEEPHRQSGGAPQAHFEFFVNSVALKTNYKIVLLPIAKVIGRQIAKRGDRDSYIDRIVNHPLAIGKRVFFVGYRPLENGESATFQGSLRRIFFDPNASCPTCVD